MSAFAPVAATGPSRLVGVTSILVDVTLTVPALPPRGGDVLATGSSRAAGGGINALAAAARLGLPACYAGPHGTGPNGDAVRAALRADGIALLSPVSAGHDTGWCLALVEPDGERTFVTDPGAEAAAAGAVLAGLELRAGDAIYASGYDLGYPGAGPDLGHWLAGLAPSADGGPLLALDPGPLAADIPAERLDAVLRRVDLLSLSAGDAEVLGGVDALARRLRPAAATVLRLGAGGALVLAAGARTTVPAAALPGAVVDTNGAGDVHLGALLAGLHDGLELVEAVSLANRAAAWSVTRPGANCGPHRGDLASFDPP